MSRRRLSAFTPAEIEADPAAARGAFGEDGAVVVRGLLDEASLSAFRATLAALMGRRLHSAGAAPPDAGDDIDALLAALTAVDPHLAMDVIRIAKNSPAFYRAFTEPRILASVAALLGTGLLHCVHDIALFRIDPPDDHGRAFGWHQDYHYNVASTNAVTGWWPLTPVTRDMGHLAIVPGSHRAMLPVRVDGTRHVAGRGTGHSQFEIVGDREAWERDATEIDDLAPGDAVLFSCLLLHRSGVNRSRRARWTVNPRYAAADDDAVVARGWRTVSDRETRLFLDLHPDLVQSA